MPTSTLSGVRGALANRLGAIPGDITIYGEIPQTWTVGTCFAIVPKSNPVRETFAGQRRLHFQIYVYVPAADSLLGQQQLDPFLSEVGSQSIEATIMTDPTLGGVVDCCTPEGWPAYGSIIEAAKSPTGRRVIIAILDAEV